MLVPKHDFARLLAHVAKAVNSRNTIPILGHVRLVASGGALTVTATDLDIEISGTLPVEGDLSCCVDAKLLASIVGKAAGDTITIEHDGNRLTVKSGRSRFTLDTLPIDDFPTMQAGEFTTEFDVDLAALCGPCAFAISTEETRYYLNGVYLHVVDGRLVAVATDGHRLSRHYGDQNGAGWEGVILPRKLVGLLPKGIVRLAVSTGKVRVTGDGVVLLSKVIDGTFPNYQRVIPTSNEKIVLASNADLRAAVERVSTVSTERGRAVKLEIAPGQIALSVRGDAEATDSIDAEYDGDPMEIGFNATYVSELLGNLTGDTVRIALNDSGSPTIFTGGDDDVLVVLMPMRV